MKGFRFQGMVWIFAIVAASCGDATNPIGPSNQPEIANNRDTFQFQASSLSRTTQTLTYTWENTGTSANVNQSGSISNGTATLTIRTASRSTAEVSRRRARSRRPQGHLEAGESRCASTTSRGL